MKVVTSIATVIVYLLPYVLGTEVATGKIRKFSPNYIKFQPNCPFVASGYVTAEEVNICKRNDPQIRKCFCENYNRLIPVIKNGVPEMNIMPIDPVQVEHIIMEWPQTRAVQFRGELNNITLHGLSLGRAVQCNIYVTEDGVQIALELVFPEIDMTARYKGSGRYMMFALYGNGDFWGKYSGINLKSVWNSTHFTKHDKDHLKFTAEITHLKIEQIQIHFANLLGNSTEINEKINEMINENIDLLYYEVKPIILQTVAKVSMKLINDLYYRFPYDVLFPNN